MKIYALQLLLPASNDFYVELIYGKEGVRDSNS
jgi:hypothetical protein